VELLNEDGRLRPGDLATAHIEVPIGATGDVYDSDLAGKWISPMHPQIIQDAPGQCPICGMDLVPTSRFGFAGEPVAQPRVLVVPRDAVLMAGQNSVVYVETEPGRFEIRPVQLGTVAERSAVILSGLREGEQVATSGNFLIDSQMQLAGRPSLIDPTRAIAKSGQPKAGPLRADKIDVQPLSGPAGERLEALYRAYTDVQAQLASDQKVSEPQALAVRQAAGDLLQAEDLPADMRGHVQAISDNAEHLHHLDVAAAREHFRIISRHVAQLAFEYRGEEAEGPLLHFYCPMVKDGGADWLQTGGELRNPYFGASMLRCGELVHTLPPRGPVEEPSKHDESKL
jgi:Cu(I)/Ag(I) efflux system membrane fusion protein